MERSWTYNGMMGSVSSRKLRVCRGKSQCLTAKSSKETHSFYVIPKDLVSEEGPVQKVGRSVFCAKPPIFYTELLLAIVSSSTYLNDLDGRHPHVSLFGKTCQSIVSPYIPYDHLFNHLITISDRQIPMIAQHAEHLAVKEQYIPASTFFKLHCFKPCIS